MKTFEKEGPENTDEALNLALEAALNKGLDIVVASTSGNTVEKLIEKAQDNDYKGTISCVRAVYGTKEKGQNEMDEKEAQSLQARGIQLVTAAHALSGAERGMSSTFKGLYPTEIVAAALRMFGQGVKVSVEISIMALDAGCIKYGQPVVCIGGTGRGADCVCIVTPDYSADLLKTKVNEIICKPGFY